ncbi:MULTISPECIES: NAD(P)/FAD-dependent oxidoreductase [Myroides]|uniref:FAD-dependent oxidoreductase n=1 Tax=Myroides albus TaxID=2562892 RepID=A0A6I3LJT9_9FLAO|nr:MULTISPECIES: FAD-dependent oxidoreductase [Myroides]MTG98107.1 FAD-dependent oxidoreductase [Myroides albus]MVX36255.1 FAD-dependent oxidoreductase [Myroides sp. LoEW2-1]UVD80712.1 FAD-dependent oxidoreductase [Myroides albus]
MVDYIVVGTGLAGICFTEKLISEGKSFKVIDNEGRSSSWIAGGMYNPVVLKRFTEVWKIDEQLDIALPFYQGLEKKLGIQFLYPMPLFRRLLSVEEQNNWFHAADKPNLERYLAPKLSRMDINGVEAPFGYGEVKYTGYLETHDLITNYRNYLHEKDCYLKESFDFDQLTYSSECVTYKGIQARHIVFAEGYGLLNNPFFKELPLDGTKGELMLVKIPDLKIDFMLKANVFIIPIGNDIYKVGATYNWEDKSDDPTQEAKEELIQGLKDIIDLDFEIVLHTAGVRPTVKDRRPLLGRSLESDRIHVLNGLGTRGVLLGPFVASKLFNNIENGEPLDEHLSIHRYKKFKIKN